MHFEVFRILHRVLHLSISEDNVYLCAVNMSIWSLYEVYMKSIWSHSWSGHQYAFIALSILVTASVSWGSFSILFGYCIISIFIVFWPSTVCSVISACHPEYLHNHDGPGVIWCFCSSSAGVPKWGLYEVAEQKGVWHTVLYIGFRFVWDIVIGLPWTPKGVGSFEPKEYCIFLPGAHYLTINSPDGADSSLNKLLLLLLLYEVSWSR